jgi:RHS repeat-associated protein
MWNATSGGTQLQSVVIAKTNNIDNNRIGSVNGVSYSYDAGGNLTGDGANSYTYDAQGRVVSVSGSNPAGYVYDSSNRRVKKTVGGVTTVYVWEGSQVIAEYNEASGALLAEYIHAGGRMVARESGGATRYYHADRLSTRLITDGSGVVVGAQDHLPFGEDAGATGESSKHRFTGYERDGEANSDYAINRQYQNANGKFLQPDPVQGRMVEPQSLNRYSYTNNDPINLIDPLGLDELCSESDGKGGYVIVPCPKDSPPVDPNQPPVRLYGWASSNPDLPDWANTPLFIDGFGILLTGSSGGTIEPPPGQDRYEPDGSRDCLGFVKWLARLVRDYKNRMDGGGRLGINLGKWADDYKKEDSTTGFNPELYKHGGQGGEMYIHVMAYAGLTLVANFGGIAERAAANAAMRNNMVLDATQQAQGRKESISELKGNFAGMAVGEMLVKGINKQISGRDLKRALKKELCQ